MYSIMSSAKSDTFASYFPVWSPFSFSSLIAMAQNSKTVLNRSGEDGHPCGVPDLRGNIFQLFTVEYDVSCGFVIYDIIMMRYVPSMSTFSAIVIINGC